MIHFGNILNQNFSELRGILMTQAVKLQKLENMVKELMTQQKETESEEPEAEEEELIRSPEVIPEEKQFEDELKQDNNELPTTSTPKMKRKSADADMDDNDDAAANPYGESSLLNLVQFSQFFHFSQKSTVLTAKSSSYADRASSHVMSKKLPASRIR